MTEPSYPIRLTWQEAWERIQVGERIGPRPVELPIEDQEIKLQAIKCEHPWYNSMSPFGGPILFPIWLMQAYYACHRWKYEITNRGIHAKMQVEMIRPCSPNSSLQAVLEVVEKFERKGGHYFVTVTTVEDEHGPVARIRNTNLVDPMNVYRQKKVV